MTEAGQTPPPGREPLSVVDVARYLQDGGLNRLATDGRAMVMRGRRSIVVMSLETPNTGFLVRIEEV